VHLVYICTQAGFNVTTDEPPWAGPTELTGWIWPTGQTLQTYGLT